MLVHCNSRHAARILSGRLFDCKAVIATHAHNVPCRYRAPHKCARLFGSGAKIRRWQRDGMPESDAVGGISSTDLDLQTGSNWRNGRARAGPVALVDDWVRRIAVFDDELFVGTASSGVQRYRLGDTSPHQRFLVNGDPQVRVPAYHLACEDPETSVTSLDWDGCWLVAGLAGGRMHVWNAEGALVLVASLGTGVDPCFVRLVHGNVVAAAGTDLRKWKLSRDSSRPGSVREMPDDANTLSARAHCLNIGPGNAFMVGLEDGCLELHSEDLSFIARQPLHKGAAISAVGALGNDVITGDADGNVVCWKVGDTWQRAWSSQHKGRVVAVAFGGGDTVVTGALDGTVRAWSFATGTRHFIIAGHRAWLGSICITSTKDAMLTDGRDNAVYLYDFRKASTKDR